MGEKVRRLRSRNRSLQNSHGDVKYSMGNGVAKELVCMACGHEQWWGVCLREWGMLSGGGTRGEKQENYNSIINKMQFKKFSTVKWLFFKSNLECKMGIS